MRVAAWQCRPGPLDVDGNLRRLDEACARAAARGAEILVTPEMFTTGYGIGRADVARLAEGPDGPVQAAVAAIARRHALAIVHGHPAPAPGGRAYNAATMTGPDGVVRGAHRKAHLFGDLDRALFAPSPSAPAAFDADGTRVGLLICYDVEFPEAVRHLAVAGARVVLVPTANMSGFDTVQQVLVRARAAENECPVVYANYCGSDPVFEYNGLSLICGPGGEILAAAGPDDEDLLVADLPAPPAGPPPAASYLADRRPGLYRDGS
ncbi:MAG TPA: carbon-nitrogen hydrolase family protein [Trebonia sp.]|jgi:predicted amidohydrolase|nr:carbon-nitrogen hydrolase family protein [Trebonia sp.]